MRRLFAFPSPVNESPAWLGAGVVAELAVVTLAFQQGRLLPVLAYGRPRPPRTLRPGAAS